MNVMKKLIFILCIFLKFSVSLAQTYRIDYTIGDEDGKGVLLIFSDTLSHWEEVFLLNSNNEDIIKLPSDYKIFLTKKLKENRLYYSYKTFNRVFFISDSVHIMQWNLEKETKEILGFRCKSASTLFRGRKYTAYYTTKIPASNGPWKFGGLPGIILQIISHDDRTFNFTANKITKNPVSHSFANTSVNKVQKFINWLEFKTIYQQLCDAQIAKIKAELKPGEKRQLLYLTREVIYPLMNQGKGVCIE